MAEDRYNLKEMTKVELHDWICEQQPGTPEYNSGILESMHRVAIIEQALEKNEEPTRKREFIAVIIAVLSIISIITAIVLSN